jgi:hypothetical protein
MSHSNDEVTFPLPSESEKGVSRNRNYTQALILSGDGSCEFKVAVG